MVIAFCSSKGGVGKTTAAINVVRVPINGKKFMNLFDLDSPQNASYNLTKLSKNIGINVKKTTTQQNKNIDIIEEILNEYKNNREKHIVFDCGGHDTDLIRRVQTMSNVIITPLTYSDSETLDFQNFNENIIKPLLKLNPSVQLKVLFNRVHHYDKKRYDELTNWIIENYPEYKILKTQLYDRLLYRTSFMESGKGVVEYKPNSKAAMEIKSLAKEIKSILKTIE